MPYHPKVSQNQLIEWYKMLADNSEKSYGPYKWKLGTGWMQNLFQK